MYVSLGCNQFFDDAGAPLSAGRVKIYAKGSDTLLPIYEDNGDGFVPAQNPVITANDGRIPTVFWPAALVDVVVEKSNGDGTYTELDSYVAGLDMSGFAAEAGVSTIAELRTVKPSSGMCVNVDGYYRSGDCPSRRYLWVENASNYDDGGYIIASTVDNGGRWVMLWEGERLPASLYGVMCGHSGYERKENIGNLFDVGKSVTVANLVFIPIPEVIEFDGRMAAGGSDMSPITYGLDGQRLVTIHRIAVSAVNKTLTTVSLCQIHCSGLRGESWTNAEWLIDQNWNDNDQMERISTLWFNGNTSAVHDAFMACAACSKVKVIEMYPGSLYDTLTNVDSFSVKIIIDQNSWMNINYSTSDCVIFAADALINTGATRLHNVLANLVNANNILLNENITAQGKGTFGGGNTQGGTDVALDVGKLAKFLHTELHAPMRLQYNGSQESPGKTPVIEVNSGTTFDLTVPPYSGYLDGECLRIVNITGSTISINGTALTANISPFSFCDVFRWNGTWYMEH